MKRTVARTPVFPYRWSDGPRSRRRRGISLPPLGPRRLLGHMFGRLLLAAAGGGVAFTLAVFIGGAGAGFIFSLVNPPASSLMVERFVDNHYTPRPRIFVSLAAMPKALPQCFLRLEDKHFYTHPGVDLAAIENAYTQNRRWGRVIMGGSTITQQMVRTLFLTQDRNFLRKYVEAVMSVSLDAVMDKHRILELYLNYIEWGKGVYGIGAAAKFYYDKPVSRLTYDEYSRLAAIIINPLRYNVKNLFQHPAMAFRYNVLNAPVTTPAPEQTTPVIAPVKESEGTEAGEGKDSGAGTPMDESAAADASVPEKTAPPG